MTNPNPSTNAARAFTVGQSVIANGYPGQVIRVCDGQLSGMIEVRLASGVICVSANDELTVKVASAVGSR